MRSAHAALALTFLLFAAGGPADAQTRGPGRFPQAFAAAQAPEGAVEMCHAATPRAAEDCARAKCGRRAGGQRACFQITVCAPGGWAGLMGIKLKEVHFTQALCGAPSPEALVAAFKAYCAGNLPQVEACTLAQVWDPNGRQHEIDTTWTAAELAK